MQFDFELIYNDFVCTYWLFSRTYFNHVSSWLQKYTVILVSMTKNLKLKYQMFLYGTSYHDTIKHTINLHRNTVYVKSHNVSATTN